MAAPAFGFSFGDIVSAIKILNDVRKALHETGSSKDEFQNVQIELQHLGIILEHLHHGTWDYGGDAGHLNAIKGMASTCQVPLQEFLTKIEKYKILQAKELSGVRARLKGEARKVQWAVTMKEDVEKFRAIIVAKIVTITLLIQPHIISTMSKIEAKSQAILDTSLESKKQIQECEEEIKQVTSNMQKLSMEGTLMRSRIDRLVQICAGTKVGVEDFRRLSQARHIETKRHLNRLQREQNRGFAIIVSQTRVISSKTGSIEDLLRQLVRLFGGFTTAVVKILKQCLKKDLEIYALLREVHCTILRQPLLAREDSILFTDALGRSRTLQYDVFQHWEVFESMLKCEFKQKPGEQRVIQGQYHLLKGSRTKDLIIDPKKWERAVFPGANISMSMVIVGLLFQEGLCPRVTCGARNLQPTDGSTLIICSTCQLEYRCAEAVVPRQPTVDETVNDFRLNIRPAGGQDMFRSRNIERLRETALSPDTTDQAGLPEFSAAEYLLEEELEAFKVIHIQTQPRIEEPPDEDIVSEYETQTEDDSNEAIARAAPSLDISIIEDNKEVCYGWTGEAKIQTSKVPTPDPGSVAISSKAWPEVKIVLQRRLGSTANIIDAVDGTREIIGSLDIRTANCLTPLLASGFSIRIVSRIPSRMRKENDHPPGSKVLSQYDLHLSIYGPKKHASQVGEQLAQAHLFLQTPPDVETDVETGVELHNPHFLPFHQEPSDVKNGEVKKDQTPIDRYVVHKSRPEGGQEKENEEDYNDDDQVPEILSDNVIWQKTPPPSTPPEPEDAYHATPESRIGMVLGQSLQLKGVLGTGAYSVVYSAIDIATNMWYAVKALSKYNANGEPLSKLEREFQTRGIRLHYMASAHPNIVSMLKIVDASDCVYVILEYYPDGDLFDNITEKGRYIRHDASIRTAFLQIIDAVAHCHSLGIYHRSIRPEDILVNGSQLALGDFALATTNAYSQEHGCGSLFYMSPECLDSSPMAPPFRNAPNNIWSLGVTLINLTCGRNPWKQASLEDSTYRAFTKDHNFLKSILPLSDELNNILTMIFEPDPDKRITISELRDAVLGCSSFFPPFDSDVLPTSQLDNTSDPLDYLSSSDDDDFLRNEIMSEAEYNSSWTRDVETSGDLNVVIDYERRAWDPSDLNFR